MNDNVIILLKYVSVMWMNLYAKYAVWWVTATLKRVEVNNCITYLCIISSLVKNVLSSCLRCAFQSTSEQDVSSSSEALFTLSGDVSCRTEWGWCLCSLRNDLSSECESFKSPTESCLFLLPYPCLVERSEVNLSLCLWSDEGFSEELFGFRS